MCGEGMILTTQQERFARMAKAWLDAGIEGYQQEPLCMLNFIYAYEMWKDGAGWDYVMHILDDKHPNKESLINQLHNTFGYPKEK
jgi:hypothetical protein